MIRISRKEFLWHIESPIIKYDKETLNVSFFVIIY